MTQDHTTRRAITDAGIGERIYRNRRISRREVPGECDATTWLQQGDALYDLRLDPAEENDLAGAHPGEAKGLIARLAAPEGDLEKTESRRE